MGGPQDDTRRPRRPFERLVRDVAGAMKDRELRECTVQQTADRLGEHPWRIVDALDAYAMMGGS